MAEPAPSPPRLRAVLASLGYRPNSVQNEAATCAIRAITGVAPATSVFVALCIAWRYPITRNVSEDEGWFHDPFSMRELRRVVVDGPFALLPLLLAWVTGSTLVFALSVAETLGTLGDGNADPGIVPALRVRVRGLFGIWPRRGSRLSSGLASRPSCAPCGA